MEYGKIVQDGLRCRMASKAALIRECMKTEEVTATLVSAMLDKGHDDAYHWKQERVGKLLTLQVQADDENLTKMFDQLILRNIKYNKLNQFYRMFIEPALCWDGCEIRIESLYFLVFAIIKNKRCREMLLKYTGKEQNIYYEAYKKSEFCDTPFLRFFLYQDKAAARLAIGLIVLLRQEQGNGIYYQQFMDIIYRGYKSQKNCIKKMNCFESSTFRSCVEKDQDVIMEMSIMVVMLVIAEDLNIPIQEDYFFYEIILMMHRYEEEMLKQLEESFSKESGEYYKSMQKEFRNVDSYYYCHYLGNHVEEQECLDEICSADKFIDDRSRRQFAEKEISIRKQVWEADTMERLFACFQLNLRMLSGIRLEQRETRTLFQLFGKLDKEEFRRYLLIATLCKYIHELEECLDREGQEEVQYQRACLKRDQDALWAEQKRQNEVEKKLLLNGKKLQEKQREWDSQREKLQERIADMELRHQKEKEELIALRNFAFQLQETQELPQEEWTENQEKSDARQRECRNSLEKTVIIGGHPGWQKKMKQILPDVTFLAAGNTSFDAAILHNKDYIIFNTDILKHSCYYRIMAEKKAEQKVLYVHGNNIDRCLGEICRQIGQKGSAMR